MSRAVRGDGTFRSLRVYNFRIWFLGSLVSNLGVWMQVTAMGWVVLTELTQRNAGAMGVATAFGLLPAVVLVPVTGRFMDRFDRRRMLVVCEAAFATVSLATGLLLLAHAMTLPLMLALALAGGIVAAFESPLRQAFVTDVVSVELAANAVSLASVQLNLARLAGPALAGVLLAVAGSGWVFLVNALTFVPLIASLAAMRVDELMPRTRDAASAQMRRAFAYVRSRPDLMVLFAIVFLASASAVNFAVYGAAMALGFHQSSWGFGLLASAYGVGSLTASVTVARRREAPMALIVTFALLAGLALVVSSLMPTFWAYLAVSVLAGYAILTLMATANAYMQLHTDRDVLGRVIVLYVAFSQGGTPFGAPLLGRAADAWGPRGGVALAGGTTLAAAVIGVAWLAARRRAQRSVGALPARARARRFGRPPVTTVSEAAVLHPSEPSSVP